MVVQHNLRAMNSNRMLGVTTKILSKSSEKLSSGYRINRAADDAAGLSISEKMRKQIRGLTQASANAEDGISSVQTAEGALTEVHDMLQRMNELATKASNGTNSMSDRQTIQDEVDQLLTEIDRVSETTKFNEIYLLKGNYEGKESVKLVNAHDAGIKGTLIDKQGSKTAEFKLAKALEIGDEITIAGEKYKIGNKAVNSGDKFAQYSANSATTGLKTLKAGDSITFAPKTGTETPAEYKTATMAAKITTASIGDLDNTKNAGTTVVIKDKAGAETTYVINGTKAGTTSSDGSTQYMNAADLESTVANALNEGKTVTMTKFAAEDAGTVVEHDVKWEGVDKLANGEIGGDGWYGKTVSDIKDVLDFDTSVASNAKEAKYRSVVLGGVTTHFTNSIKTISADNFATAVSMLKSGETMKIEVPYRGLTTAAGKATTITIADETDAKSNKYTTADALALVDQLDGDLDDVTITLSAGNNKAKSYLKSLGFDVNDTTGVVDTFTVTTSPTKGETSENVITAADAYAKIAAALKQASSIGTDTAALVKDNGNGTFSITKGSASVKDALSFNLHVGADADMSNKINVKIDTIDTRGLGINKLDVIGKNANGEKIDDGGIAATYAIDSIADAIAKVSAQRSLLGAVQNRLDHTINNIGNIVENTTAAESQIRDTDMATEMVRFANSNILAQAGQSILAQANQANQGVMSLLG